MSCASWAAADLRALAAVAAIISLTGVCDCFGTQPFKDPAFLRPLHQAMPGMLRTPPVGGFKVPQPAPAPQSTSSLFRCESRALFAAAIDRSRAPQPPVAAVSKQSLALGASSAAIWTAQLDAGAHRRGQARCTRQPGGALTAGQLSCLQCHWGVTIDC